MSQLPDTSVLSLPQPSLRAFSSMSSSNSDLSLSLSLHCQQSSHSSLSPSAAWKVSQVDRISPTLSGCSPLFFTQKHSQKDTEAPAHWPQMHPGTHRHTFPWVPSSFRYQHPDTLRRASRHTDGSCPYLYDPRSICSFWVLSHHL